jgi:hypothetical protein
MATELPSPLLALGRLLLPLSPLTLPRFSAKLAVIVVLPVLVVAVLVVLVVLVVAGLGLPTLTPSQRQLVRRAHAHHVVVLSVVPVGLTKPEE